MTTFFDKLKKGMEIKNLPPEELPEKKPSKKKERKPKKEKEKKFEIKVAMADEKEKKLAGRSLGEDRWFQPEGQLTVDVYQTDKEIVIQSAIAGVNPEDLDISIENDVVTIRGNRERLFEKEEKNYFYQECYWGRFFREIILPAEIDSQKATATMKKGVLTIRIPKIEKEDKRKISVEE